MMSITSRYELKPGTNSNADIIGALATEENSNRLTSCDSQAFGRHPVPLHDRHLATVTNGLACPGAFRASREVVL